MIFTKGPGISGNDLNFLYMLLMYFFIYSLRDDYNESVAGMEHLLARRTEPSNLLFFGELHGSKNFVNKMDELTCYLPGTLALGVHYGMPKHHMKIAEDLMYTCTLTWLRQPTNLAPEITYYNTQVSITKMKYFSYLDKFQTLV